MVKKVFWMLLSISISVVISLAACNHKVVSPIDSYYLSLFPNVEFNKKIQIEYVPIPIERTIGSEMTLLVTDISRDNILFPKDFGIKIYIYDEAEAKWQSVKNLMNYFPDKSRGLTPDESNRRTGVVLKPDLLNEGHSVTIRVSVQGEVYHGETPTGQQVGAYTDITLEP